MEGLTNRKLRLISYVVIVYMLLAFAWWSVLLYTKNQDAFRAKRDLMRIGMVATGKISSQDEFLARPEYQQLKQSYQKQEYMILGEACVFVISLVIGVWFINRGYNKEITTAQQRRNFLLSITHELKSPIASIRLVLETMMRRQLQPQQVDQLSQNALKETERLNTLVNDLLLSARLDDAYQPTYEELDLNEILEDLVEKLSNKYPKANLSYHKDVDAPYIVGDRLGLSSVALNLLENAVKYSPKDHVHIECELSAHKGKLIMTISDEGFGVDEKEKKKIFEKFYRVGNEDTRKTKGTGLGLYIVDQIVKAHNGRIEVEDNQPRGTRFRIILPTGENKNQVLTSRKAS